jgi:hypothetical protein
VDYTAYSEDGILSAETQAPPFIAKNDGINRRLEARNANHLEETAHPNVRERLSEIFGNSDVDIPLNDGGDGGGPGDGDDGDECFADRFGNCIEF